MGERRKKQPAVDRAFDYIRENLESGAWKRGEALPSTRTLALGAGVSPVSMLKAVSLLKSKGFINGIERGRLRVGAAPVQKPPSSENASSVWRLKRAALEKEILAGAYADREKLPSYKELQARYGTCFQTMRKILRSMVADGVVRLSGKTFFLEHPASHSSLRRIVYITYRVQSAPQSALNQEHYRVIDQLEHECFRRNLVIDIVEIDFYDPVATRRSAALLGARSPDLGYVLDLWWFVSEELRRSYADLLARLVAQKRPVAILDELGSFVLPIQFSSNRLLQVFRIEGKGAGTRVARLLLGLGHQSVVYISSMHISPWSRQRLEGIEEQYGRAGRAADVHAVVTDTLDVPLLNILMLSGFDDGLIRRIIAVDRTEKQAEDQYRALLRFRESSLAHSFNAAEAMDLRENLNCLKVLDQQHLSKDFFDPLCRTALRSADAVVFALFLAPLFEQALSHAEATAWICATDAMAVAALSYLRNRGIAVPRDLSVVGFDNRPAYALENRLTSFDFNVSGFAHRMLNFIVRPPRGRGTYRHMPIEIEGSVMMRETTAKPRSEGQGLSARPGRGS